MTNNELERKAFEAWWNYSYNGEPPFYGWEKYRHSDGYTDPDIHAQWEAWQARANLEKSDG